jgi:hypothetical protein
LVVLASSIAGMVMLKATWDITWEVLGGIMCLRGGATDAAQWQRQVLSGTGEQHCGYGDAESYLGHHLGGVGGDHVPVGGGEGGGGVCDRCTMAEAGVLVVLASSIAGMVMLKATWDITWEVLGGIMCLLGGGGVATDVRWCNA